jgi:hypothetical protein
MQFRRFIALLLVSAYLLLPLDSFANLTSPGSSSLHTGAAPSLHNPPALRIASPRDSAPQCPCSDHHDADDCNATCSCCSCCSFFAPLLSGISYLPTTTEIPMLEPSARFPKVYLAIFVPPQNRI